MPKNVSFYSNAVSNIFLRNGCIVTLIVEVCHAMFAIVFFFFVCVSCEDMNYSVLFFYR